MTNIAKLIPDGDPLAPWEGRLTDPGSPPVRRAWAATRLVMAPSYASIAHQPQEQTDPAELLPHVDWQATDDLRRRMDQAGLGVAEAMDTAQRFRIGWDIAAKLIERTSKLGLTQCFIAGAASDHAPRAQSPRDLGRAVAEQVRYINLAGGIPMVLPMVQLAQRNAPPQDYIAAFDAILEHSDGVLLVHWLGAAFHPDLEAYFPGDSFEQVMALDRQRIAGVKLSLLDAAQEVKLRRELLQHGQVVLTGDDLHFAQLVAGTRSKAQGMRLLGGAPLPLGDFSHALLGILDAAWRPFALALRLLSEGDREGYDEVAQLAESLGRQVFSAPTSAYKAGLAFRGWLAGEQETLLLAGHEETLRTAPHLLEVARLAAAAGALGDPLAARRRLQQWLNRHAHDR